ncbi:hypothetical protein H310_08216 [Aphanomyces invadans]|uniref:Uncharacterized protein n=1 Tax=Aphanomyces invadans TaxID=157072 RepID=A0A024U0Y1_9STRA|nr:hypothetical protein H310_08216 [Aphanomyces invadans]ETV99556.1 hypothetical protein H310_08216 [Aphanomyces invadans]|eukprot:XP_008872112.1 hypothetical protein H310_08216 [Aphanomyces invadans]
MRLEQIYVRHYPPGLRLSSRQSNGSRHHKSIDLVSLGPETNLRLLVNQLIEKEALLTKAHTHRLYDILHGLIDKQCIAHDTEYTLVKTIKAHMQPLTNISISKQANLVATSSYDKTAKLLRWKGGQDDKVVLRGHEGVVYCVALNTPYSSHAVTGSFDKTCRVWDTTTGTCKQVLAGHEGEVVAVGFNSPGTKVGSCSMDCTATVWDVATGKAEFDLTGHAAEVSCFAFDQSKSSSFMATGSCDSTVRLWDARYGECFRSLHAHAADVSTVSFNHQSNLLLTTSTDGTAKVWDVQSGKSLFILNDHSGEVTGACFNSTGSLMATAGIDGHIYVYDTLTAQRRSHCSGHSGEGGRIVSAGADHTSRVWQAQTGECLQVLRGHDDEVFAAHFSYDGAAVVTASKDNAVRVFTDNS